MQLDCVITDELRKEGIAREIIRQIQNERKKNKCNARDMVKVKLVLDKETAEAVQGHKGGNIREGVAYRFDCHYLSRSI